MNHRNSLEIHQKTEAHREVLFQLLDAWLLEHAPGLYVELPTIAIKRHRSAVPIRDSPRETPLSTSVFLFSSRSWRLGLSASATGQVLTTGAAPHPCWCTTLVLLAADAKHAGGAPASKFPFLPTDRVLPRPFVYPRLARCFFHLPRQSCYPHARFSREITNPVQLFPYPDHSICLT